MKRIIIVRHGDYLGSASGSTSLSDKGKMQFWMVTERLRRETGRISAIVSSPLQRAMESAEILSRALAIEVCVEDCIDDRAGTMDDIVAALKRYDAADTAVLVSHMAVVMMMAKHYMAEFGEKKGLMHFPKNGEGFMIDLERRTVTQFC